MTAKEIMRTDVLTVRPDMTVEELGRFLMEKDISGAPVADENGNLLGIVTENDLISREKRLHIPTLLRIFDAYVALEPPSIIEKEIKKMAAINVIDICTRDVITAKEDTPVEDLATLMTEKRVHLVPIVKNGKIIGMVGRHEMLKTLS
ncbi:MAG: CBS domain-containing protein [Nitrospiraceae bacterium]|nr:CBS domain-containing protein [Nitrospiraceae bacterium]